MYICMYIYMLYIYIYMYIYTLRIYIPQICNTISIRNISPPPSSLYIRSLSLSSRVFKHFSSAIYLPCFFISGNFV